MKADEMKVSVVVTTYNQPDALMRVLEGLSMQKRPPNEIIIADDGSGSETRCLVEAFIRNTTIPAYHVWHEDVGYRLSAIRNKAIQACNYEYIVFLDGDCVPDPNYIKDHDRFSAPGFFFQGKRVLIDMSLSPDFTVASIIGGNHIRLLRSKHVSNKHHLFRLPWLPVSTSKRLSGVRGCNMGFFKNDLLAVNGYNEDFHGWGREDSELVVRLYKYGLKRRQHNFAAICYHLWHPENPRHHLAQNDQLLAQAIASDSYICRNGISRR